MKAVFGFIVLLFFLTSCAQLAATSTLYNPEGEQVGIAVLKEVRGGVEIRLEGTGLKPGKHGFHVHTVGSCIAPDFTSAGGHFNPDEKEHGRKNPNGHHVGDLSNIQVGPKGDVAVTVTAERAMLSEGSNSLLDEDGSALVIHAQADDEVSDPAGDAGPRIACGVIE